MSASSAAFFVFLHEAQAPIIITANADAINVDIVFIVFCFFVRKSFLGGEAFWAGCLLVGEACIGLSKPF